METYGKKLTDQNGNVIAPKTRSELVYRPGNETVENSISRPNLLDNWHFASPVNQRDIYGAFSTAGQYFIDRWILVSGSARLGNGGLKLNGTIRQEREFAVGLPTVASVYCSRGSATASYSDITGEFDVTSSGGTLVAVKLEAGDCQTLKNPDGSLRDGPPNFAGELAKCQRYYQILKAGENGYGYSGSGGGVGYVSFPLVVPLAKEPSLTFNGGQLKTYADGVSPMSNISSVEVYRVSDRAIYMDFIMSPIITRYTSITAELLGDMILNAEL